MDYNQKRSQLTNLKLQKTDNSDVVTNISYDYYNGGGGSGGNNGRIRYITDHLDGNYSVDVGYDDYNRLTSYGSYRSYTYDAWNNLLSVSSSNGVGEAPNYTLTYATNGSGAPSTNRINNSGYTYDAAGRLKTAGTNNSCEYDGDGRKVKQVSGGYALFYLWSSVLGEPVVELDGSGGVYRAYVLNSGGQMLAVQSYDGGFYWLHTDHLGNGRKLTNTSGSVIYRAEFDPHGQMLYEWQSSGQTYLNSHKFTGYERDWATNLNYAKARTYNHNRARFLQPDPLGLAAADLTDPQSLNRYSYVGNDPANFTDPTELFCYARYEVTTTYGNGQVIGEIWQFIGIFCDSYYQPIQPIDGGGGVGGGGGAEPQRSQPQKSPCPSGRELAGNSTVMQAMNQAFRDSQFGTPNAHEEGGHIWRNRQTGNILVIRVPPGNSASSGPMRLPGVVSDRTPNSPASGYALVGTFHTHPYSENQPVTGNPNYVYDRPARPSAADRNVANSLGVPGLIRYQDRNGNPRISVHGPDRNRYC